MSSWLPGCTKQDFGTNGGSWTRAPAIICIHSTEGGSWPGYDSGQSAPHFTLNVDTGERRQHISMGVAARALSHPSGTPETNRAGVIQIEVIGTCDPAQASRGWPYMPALSSSQLAHLSRLVQDIATDQGIPYTSAVTFAAYPGSYGSGGTRLSRSSFSSYRGILGHQHVPDNDHGDPGALDIGALLAGSAPEPEQVTAREADDMVLIYGKSPYLLSGGRLCPISVGDKDRAAAAGVPTFGVDSDSWQRICDAFVVTGEPIPVVMSE